MKELYDGKTKTVFQDEATGTVWLLFKDSAQEKMVSLIQAPIPSGAACRAKAKMA